MIEAEQLGCVKLLWNCISVNLFGDVETEIKVEEIILTKLEFIYKTERIEQQST